MKLPANVASRIFDLGIAPYKFTDKRIKILKVKCVNIYVILNTSDCLVLTGCVHAPKIVTINVNASSIMLKYCCIIGTSSFTYLKQV